VRRAVAREEPGVQEQRREQEQPADTVRRAVAREEPRGARTKERTRASQGCENKSENKSNQLTP